MPKTYKYENPERLKLIQELKKLAREKNAQIWKAVAGELSRPRRTRKEINLGKLSKVTSKNEFILVPGKLLGSGDLDHKLEIVAFQFTSQAKEKVNKAGGKIISIQDVMKKNPKGSGIRIMG